MVVSSKKYKELIKRVEALEYGATVFTFKYGRINLKALARIVEKIKPPAATGDSNG